MASRRGHRRRPGHPPSPPPPPKKKREKKLGSSTWPCQQANVPLAPLPLHPTVCIQGTSRAAKASQGSRRELHTGRQWQRSLARHLPAGQLIKIAHPVSTVVVIQSHKCKKEGQVEYDAERSGQEHFFEQRLYGQSAKAVGCLRLPRPPAAHSQFPGLHRCARQAVLQAQPGSCSWRAASAAPCHARAAPPAPSLMRCSSTPPIKLPPSCLREMQGWRGHISTSGCTSVLYIPAAVSRCKHNRPPALS